MDEPAIIIVKDPSEYKDWTLEEVAEEAALYDGKHVVTPAKCPIEGCDGYMYLEIEDKPEISQCMECGEVRRPYYAIYYSDEHELEWKR